MLRLKKYTEENYQSNGGGAGDTFRTPDDLTGGGGEKARTLEDNRTATASGSQRISAGGRPEQRCLWQKKL